MKFLRDGDESGQLVKGKHDAFRVSLDAYLGLDMHHSGSLHSTQRTGSDPVHMPSGAQAPQCQRGVPMMHFPSRRTVLGAASAVTLLALTACGNVAGGSSRLIQVSPTVPST